MREKGGRKDADSKGNGRREKYLGDIDNHSLHYTTTYALGAFLFQNVRLRLELRVLTVDKSYINDTIAWACNLPNVCLKIGGKKIETMDKRGTSIQEQLQDVYYPYMHRWIENNLEQDIEWLEEMLADPELPRDLRAVFLTLKNIQQGQLAGLRKQKPS